MEAVEHACKVHAIVDTSAERDVVKWLLHNITVHARIVQNAAKSAYVNWKEEARPNNQWSSVGSAQLRVGAASRLPRSREM
jgi:hypothetical protein